jgi:hypothetical protein
LTNEFVSNHCILCWCTDRIQWRVLSILLSWFCFSTII